MSFDGVFLRRYVELSKIYLNYRVNRIAQWGPHHFIFSLWKEGHSDHLVVSINPSLPYLSFSQNSFESFDEPSHFLLLLKRFLEGSRLVNIEPYGIDRIIKLSFEKTDELGDTSIKILIIELTGRITNLILLKEDGVILDAYKRIPPHELMQRTIHPGAIYKVPLVPNKADPFLPNQIRTEDYSDTYMGISQPLNNELIWRIHHGESFQQIMNQIQHSKSIYMSESEFHFIPFQSMKSPVNEYPWQYALSHFYHQRMAKDAFQQTLQPIRQILKKELDKALTKQARLQEDYDNAKNGPIFERYGTLLFTYAQGTPKGTKEVVVQDQETNEIHTIPMDPLLDLAKNAQKYYKKYRKSQNALPILKDQIEKNNALIDYFRQFQWQIDFADLASLNQIKEELEQQGYLKSHSKPKNLQNKKIKKRNYVLLTWKSPSGTVVSIGKNNLQNDWLTFEKAQPNDIFFHVQGYHGSHVILHNSDPDDKTIQRAAELAAYYSAAKSTSKVAVNYAPVKTIKKIPGGPPGMVRYQHYQTLVVKPIGLEEAK